MKHRAIRWLVIFLLVAAGLVAAALLQRPDNLLHVAFLDVGQGDAVLFYRGSQQVLVDGGPGPQALELELGRLMPFWDRTIELVVLTHEHTDHITGLVDVLKDYQVGRVLLPAFESDLPVCQEWRRLIEEKAIPTTSACAGQLITLGGVTIYVLNPPQTPLTDTDSDIDNASIVLRVEMEKVSFLLCGDMGCEGENELIMQRLAARTTVLKVGHHGSASATSAAFLDVVMPDIAVISVGAGNDYGLPSQETIDRLENAVGAKNIYRTDERGTIEFTTDGGHLWVTTER